MLGAGCTRLRRRRCADGKAVPGIRAERLGLDGRSAVAFGGSDNDGAAGFAHIVRPIDQLCLCHPGSHSPEPPWLVWLCRLGLFRSAVQATPSQRSDTVFITSEVPALERHMTAP